jgi:hypothetical protein
MFVVVVATNSNTASLEATCRRLMPDGQIACGEWWAAWSDHPAEQWCYLQKGQAGAGRGRISINGQPQILGRAPNEQLTDLIAANLSKSGSADGPGLDGSFAVVSLELNRRRLTANCDQFATVPLYYASDSTGTLWLSDRLDKLPSRGSHDLEFIADFLATGGSAERTIWSGAKPVGPATTLTWEDGRFTRKRYWQPESLPKLSGIDEPEAAAEYRRLLDDSVHRSPTRTTRRSSGAIRVTRAS